MFMYGDQYSTGQELELPATFPNAIFNELLTLVNMYKQGRQGKDEENNLLPPLQESYKAKPLGQSNIPLVLMLWHVINHPPKCN